MGSEFGSLRFPRLKQLDVSLTGGWRRDGAPSWSAARPAWAGVAIAAEPIVALYFIETRDEVRWVRGKKQNADFLPVEISYSSDAYAPYRWVSFGGLMQMTPFVAGDCPVLTFLPKIRTGEIVSFAVLENDPETRFHLLLVARSDTRGRRCGLWHLRRRLRDAPDDRWSRVFAFGRTGGWRKSTVTVRRTGPLSAPAS